MDELTKCSSPRPTKECIIAQKIFDQCRLQICLTSNIIGPARAIPGGQSCCTTSGRGDVITPPANAVSVAVRNLCTSNVAVINKTPCSLRLGFWDITIKFTFTYCLIFFDSENQEISSTLAQNTYTTTLCLYGGQTMCITSYNEAFPSTQLGGPFVNIDTNAVALAACLSYPCPTTPVLNCNCNCNCNSNCGNQVSPTMVNNCECTSPAIIGASPVAINVTIGLFAVVKLFRLSNMCVENFGDCMPEECTTVSPTSTDPCAFFDELDFPVNLFAPQADYTPSKYKGTLDILPGNTCCLDESQRPSCGTGSTGGAGGAGKCGCKR